MELILKMKQSLYSTAILKDLRYSGAWCSERKSLFLIQNN